MVLPAGSYQAGDLVPADGLAEGVEVEANGQVVGIAFLTGKAPDRRTDLSGRCAPSQSGDSSRLRYRRRHSILSVIKICHCVHTPEKGRVVSRTEAPTMPVTLTSSFPIIELGLKCGRSGRGPRPQWSLQSVV